MDNLEQFAGYLKAHPERRFSLLTEDAIERIFGGHIPDGSHLEASIKTMDCWWVPNKAIVEAAERRTRWHK